MCTCNVNRSTQKQNSRSTTEKNKRTTQIFEVRVDVADSLILNYYFLFARVFIWPRTYLYFYRGNYNHLESRRFDQKPSLKMSCLIG